MSIKGIEEMVKNIQKLETQNKRAANKAVREAADLVEKNLIGNTPKDSGELASSTVQSGIKGSSTGDIEIDVGYNHESGWRAHFVDSGTIYQKGQHFKDKTTEGSRDGVLNIFDKNIKEGLNL